MHASLCGFDPPHALGDIETDDRLHGRNSSDDVATPTTLKPSVREASIPSSENLVFFMVPSVPEGPLSQSINWTENRPAGHHIPVPT